MITVDLQIEYLRTFITLAEVKGFTKTGQQINKSQSAVSMQIKRLEEEVGKKLFERVGRTAILTGDGRVLLKHAVRIVKEHDEAVRALSEPDLKGYIRFGSPEHYTVEIMHNLLSNFASIYPDVVVEMQCKNSDEIKDAVEKGELDLGICSQLHHSEQVIAYDPLVWIVKPGVVLPEHGILPLAAFDEGCIFRAWTLDALEKQGMKYRIVYVSQSVSGLIEAVRAGLAIAPVVRSNVPSDLNIIGLENGLPMLPVSHIVLHKVKGKASDTVECFSEHVVRSFGENA